MSRARGDGRGGRRLILSRRRAGIFIFGTAMGVMIAIILPLSSTRPSPLLNTDTIPRF